MQVFATFLRTFVGAFACVFVSLHTGTFALGAPKKAQTAILVDKKSNQLTVAEYVQGEFKPIQVFHATLGKVKGDKEDEGDLKTPEGIYTFKQKLYPPSIKPKFGAMAFYINYPNTYDAIAGRTGFDIMLHATDEPTRLKQDYDSEGCVVVKNEEIKQIEPYIRPGLTPILIFPEVPGLTAEYMKPGSYEPLQKFFNAWVSAWESRDIEAYIQQYHSDFSHSGMGKAAYKKYKAGLIDRYATISVGPEEVHYYRHPKYSMVTFTQNYKSTLKKGGIGHRSRGTKILYVGEESGQPKVIAESFSQMMW